MLRDHGKKTMNPELKTLNNETRTLELVEEELIISTQNIASLPGLSQFFVYLYIERPILDPSYQVQKVRVLQPEDKRSSKRIVSMTFIRDW